MLSTFTSRFDGIKECSVLHSDFQPMMIQKTLKWMGPMINWGHSVKSLEVAVILVRPSYLVRRSDQRCSNFRTPVLLERSTRFGSYLRHKNPIAQYWNSMHKHSRNRKLVDFDGFAWDLVVARRVRKFVWASLVVGQEVKKRQYWRTTRILQCKYYQF